VRSQVILLWRDGSEKGLAVLEKALADQVVEVRISAVEALGDVGGEKVRDLLLARLAKENDSIVFDSIRNSLSQSMYRTDPIIQKALKEIPHPTP
jgi:HEAT repeat protein